MALLTNVRNRWQCWHNSGDLNGNQSPHEEICTGQKAQEETGQILGPKLTQ